MKEAKQEINKRSKTILKIAKKIILKMWLYYF